MQNPEEQLVFTPPQEDDIVQVVLLPDYRDLFRRFMQANEIEAFAIPHSGDEQDPITPFGLRPKGMGAGAFEL